MRVMNHPVLGEQKDIEWVTIIFNGKPMKAEKGEMILAALHAENQIVNRYTAKRHEPRGIYCGIGQCTDCMMVVNGIPNVRTCITPVEDGMTVEIQEGLGKWRGDK
ncbi:MAG: (2Fe-2S)-binding protein [Acidaminococcaceae bacterium]|nr:(2Fe-2S)-binding protein [Acidaminococcaceae bacterium]MCI2110133.1 (2Fe-2S)-binding protein [Acidaminococcaceae bacterium]